MKSKVAGFYTARTANMAALPWPNFAPPFSPLRNRNECTLSAIDIDLVDNPRLTTRCLSVRSALDVRSRIVEQCPISRFYRVSYVR